jgi:hypothetical protein
LYNAPTTINGISRLNAYGKYPDTKVNEDEIPNSALLFSSTLIKKKL